jgi:hypothetical protein
MRLTALVFAALIVVAWLSTPATVAPPASPLATADAVFHASLGDLALGETSLRDLVQQQPDLRLAVRFTDEPEPHNSSAFEARLPRTGISLDFHIGARALGMLDKLKRATRDPETFALADPVAAEAKLAFIGLESPWTGRLAVEPGSSRSVALGDSVLAVFGQAGEPPEFPRLTEPRLEDEDENAPVRYVAGPVRIVWRGTGASTSMTFARADHRPATEPPVLVRIALATTMDAAAPSGR